MVKRKDLNDQALAGAERRLQEPQESSGCRHSRISAAHV
jgi:hypothetical protein